MTYDQEPESGIESVEDGTDLMATDGQLAHPQADEATFVGLGELEESDADDDADAPIQLDEVDAPSPATPAAMGDVRAESVTISGGSANSVEAETVSVNQGGVAQVRANEVSISQGGVALARTEHLTVAEDASAFAVLADSAEIHEGSNVFMLFARSVSGEGRPVLDWRAALAIGAGFAVVLRVLRRR